MDLMNDWELATRSQVELKWNIIMNHKIHLDMFLDALNEMNIDLNDFDKNFL